MRPIPAQRQTSIEYGFGELSDLLDTPTETASQPTVRFAKSMRDIEFSEPDSLETSVECQNLECLQTDHNNKIKISNLLNDLSRYARLEAELCNERLRIRELEAKVQKCERENDQLQVSKDEELQKERDDHAATKKELTAAQSRLDKQTQQHNTDLSDSRKAHEEAISDKDVQNQKLHASLAAAEKTMLDQIKELNHKKEELNALLEKWRQSDLKKDQKLQQHQEDLGAARQEHKELQQQHEDHIAEYDTLRQHHVDRVSEYNTLKQNHQDHMSDYNNLSKKHEDHVSEFNDVKAQLDNIESRFDILTSQHDDLKSQHADHTSQYDTLKSQNDELKVKHDGDLKQSQVDLDASKRRVLDIEARKDDEIKNMEAEQERMSMTIRSLEKQLDTVDSINDETLRQVRAQVAENLSEAFQANAQVRQCARLLQGEKVTREATAKTRSRSASTITVELPQATETAPIANRSPPLEMKASGSCGDGFGSSTLERGATPDRVAKFAAPTREAIRFEVPRGSARKARGRSAEDQLEGKPDKKQKVVGTLASESCPLESRVSAYGFKKRQQHEKRVTIRRSSQTSR